MSLQTIEQSLTAAAAAEWAKIKSEGIIIEQTLEADAKSTFELAVEQFGPLIMQTISSLATAEFASLSGGEKMNLAATTITEKAGLQGVTLLASDTTALIQNGFEAFKAAAPALVPEALPAVGAAAEGVLGVAETAVENAVEGAAQEVEQKL